MTIEYSLNATPLRNVEPNSDTNFSHNVHADIICMV